MTSSAWADWPLGLTSAKYDAVISSVNLAEVVTKLVDRGSTEEAIDGALWSLNLTVAAFEQ